jgi:hypothetical protein
MRRKREIESKEEGRGRCLLILAYDHFTPRRESSQERE